MTREALPGLLKIVAKHAHPVLNFSFLDLLDEGHGEVFEALIKDVVAEDMRHRSDTKVFLLRYRVHLSLGSHLCQLRRCRSCGREDKPWLDKWRVDVSEPSGTSIYRRPRVVDDAASSLRRPKGGEHSLRWRSPDSSCRGNTLKATPTARC